MIFLDSIEVKVDSVMDDVVYGPRLVVSVEGPGNFPIIMANGSTYTKNGALSTKVRRSLFWAPVEIIPPAPPKPKVKVYFAVHKNSYGCFQVTQLYDAKETIELMNLNLVHNIYELEV